MPGIRRKLAVVLGLIAICVVAVVLGGWVYVQYRLSPSRWPQLQFTSQEWKALAEEKRYVFYNDLAKSSRLAGRSRREVTELLGKPSYEAPDGRYVSYIIKHADPGEPSFNTIYLLYIWFDDQGRVTRYYLGSD